jgi:hypothetical protein
VIETVQDYSSDSGEELSDSDQDNTPRSAEPLPIESRLYSEGLDSFGNPEYTSSITPTIADIAEPEEIQLSFTGYTKKSKKSKSRNLKTEESGWN